MDKIDFEQHTSYELGDTHLTYEHLSELTGYKVPTIRHHARAGGPLVGIPKVRIAGTTRKVAFKYTARLHEYVETQNPPMPTARIVELLQHMAPMEIEQKYGVSRQAQKERVRRSKADIPSWHGRLRSERAWTRMRKALLMHARGEDPYIIADVLDVGIETVKHYLTNPYVKPPPIPNRTPVWEQDHDLW